MALDEGDIIDEETGVPTTTATPPRPGATPGGSGPTPGPGPGPRPTATPVPTSPRPTRAATTFTSPLEQVMSAHNEAWLGRMRNIGAGGSSMTGITKKIPGGPLGDYKLRAIGTGVMSVLSGGFLGSYSASAKGSIQKALDAITEQRTGIDYNSTARVSNIWKSADERIHSLSTKIRLCEEIEQSIDDQITINEGITDAATALKNASNGETKTAAAEVSTMWKKIKPYLSHIGVGVGSFTTVAVLGCPPLAAAALCGMLPVGVAMTIRKAKNDPSYDPKNTKKLQEARALVNTIRKDAEHKRTELLEKLAKKYPQEVEIQKSTRAHFTTEISKVVSKKDATMLLDEYESLVMRPPIDSDGAIKALINTMSAMKRADNDSANAFSKVDLGKVKTNLDKLMSKASLEYRKKINESLGLMEATGPEQMTSLIRRVCQIHAILPQTGRILQLTIGASGEKKMYRIRAVVPGKLDINLEEVTVSKNPLTGEFVATTVPGNPVSIHPDKKTMELQRELYKVPTSELIAEMASKTENDLLCSDAHPNPPITAEVAKKHKELLAKARKERLTVSQYKELWAALKPAPVDYEKCGLPMIYKIANQTSDTFETEKEDTVKLENVKKELKNKSELDLISTGTDDQFKRRKELLERAKNENLEFLEYKELWDAFKPLPPDYEKNGLPLMFQIANDPSLVDQGTFIRVQPKRALLNEIHMKTISDLIPGTPAEMARREQLLKMAQTTGLSSVAEYRELWNALRPPPHFARNGLRLHKEIAMQHGDQFEETFVPTISDADLIAEAKKKSKLQLIKTTPSENEERNDLLDAAQMRRLSGEEYRDLFHAFKRPTEGRIGLDNLKKIAAQPGPTFEQTDVRKESVTALRTEMRIAAKTAHDLIGPPAELAEQKKLLADAYAGILGVPGYKKLWKALKKPTPGQAGLKKIEAIAKGGADPEYSHPRIEDTDMLELF